MASRLHVVNEDKEFSSNLTSQLSDWGLSDAGFNYNVVSVFGSQSTGKSTLLNKLFGTTFDVMNESQRRQTTKGIWMCKATEIPLLVMDVEGTDGRERGEDQDFERKSALFSLAASSVLLINMWEHQVGLYQGANMGLLKTVMEVNFSMFIASSQASKPPKTLLLFVIRDHIGTTPLENLRATLTNDIENIWNSVSKPEGLSEASLSDYFDLGFVTLPHKLLQPEEFDKQTSSVRNGYFGDNTSTDYILKPQYHRQIPADGLSHYLETIWDKVQNNKDLDVPTQQELLAQYRCDEIASEALKVFHSRLVPVKKPVEVGKFVPELGRVMRDSSKEALDTFDSTAFRYAKPVYEKKREELAETISTTLSPLYISQVKNLHKKAIDSYKKELHARLKSDSYDFSDVVKESSTHHLDTFVEQAKEITLAGTAWSYVETLEQLKLDMEGVSAECRSDELSKIITQLERSIQKEAGEFVEVCLNAPDADMWDKVLERFSASLERSKASYVIKASRLNSTDAEVDATTGSLVRRAWISLRAKIDEQCSEQVLLFRLRGIFEDKFRYDDKGIPRVWRPIDDIEGVYAGAREHTLNLLKLYRRIEPQDASHAFVYPPVDDAVLDVIKVSDIEEAFSYEESLQVLGEAKEAQLAGRFKKDADAIYLEAKRSVVSSISKIPLWFYVALLVLGWNELWAVLSNPIYLTLSILAAVTLYFVYTLNLGGPITTILVTVGKEVNRIIVDKMISVQNDARNAATGATSGGSGAASEGGSEKPAHAASKEY
ncbi:hypothetical protein E3P99_01767 [Wallemia hederae]|uniref:GB1/RHD3-type G domain-containing protein n=1 Tax=Wallemia hederae TaxID=1540922 RepID=A0A4V4LTF8_9BASI|nr:hypothetical protein E3P99_01767 [Wallemia hederae]